MTLQQTVRRRIDLDQVPEQSQTDLCAMAITRCAEALKTPEGRAAIERGKAEWRRICKERRDISGIFQGLPPVRAEP